MRPRLPRTMTTAVFKLKSTSKWDVCWRIRFVYSKETSKFSTQLNALQRTKYKNKNWDSNCNPAALEGHNWEGEVFVGDKRLHTVFKHSFISKRFLSSNWCEVSVSRLVAFERDTISGVVRFNFQISPWTFKWTPLVLSSTKPVRKTQPN